jgi:hypothetical protein
VAVTLTEAAKYTTNMVKRGVIETIIKDSMVLQKLPFEDIVGNALQFLRENSLAGADFYAPNEVWTESTGDVTQVTAGLCILGGDADVDNFLKATRADKTNFEAQTVDNKAKAVKHTFLDYFYNGDITVNTKAFNGLHKLVDVTNRLVSEGSGSTGSALNLTNLDIAIDKVLDGRPNWMIMSKDLRRRIKQYIQSSGFFQTLDKDDFGNRIMEYDGVDIYVDDFVSVVETISSGVWSAATGGATQSIFMGEFGTKAICGLQNGGLEVKKLGQLNDKDAARWRVRWYPGLTLFAPHKLVIVDGITSAAVAA